MDLPRIDIKVACHNLLIDLSIKPIQQKKRNHKIEPQKAIKERGDKIVPSRVHSGGLRYHMVGKSGANKEVEWQMEDVCGLHRLE